MNLASWIVLGIVIAAIAFAIKATFFKKNRRGGCCDTGDEPLDSKPIGFDGKPVGCSPSACSTCSCNSCSEMAARYKIIENNLVPLEPRNTPPSPNV